jgi:hypothetical protein
MPRLHEIQDVLERMLPPIDELRPVVTSDYGKKRDRGSSPHIGIDSAYPGGQKGISGTHPPVFSPVDGIVIDVGSGPTRPILIRDANGFIHGVLHTQDQLVKRNDRVRARGTPGARPIGTLGDRGADPGAIHNHYHVYDPTWRRINPTDYWRGRLGARPPEVQSIPVPQARPDFSYRESALSPTLHDTLRAPRLDSSTMVSAPMASGSGFVGGPRLNIISPIDVVEPSSGSMFAVPGSPALTPLLPPWLFARSPAAERERTAGPTDVRQPSTFAERWNGLSGATSGGSLGRTDGLVGAGRVPLQLAPAPFPPVQGPGPGSSTLEPRGMLTPLFETAKGGQRPNGFAFAIGNGWWP